MPGYIEKRGVNSYRLVASCGYDSNGKRQKKTKTIKADSPAKANKELALFISEVERGLVVDDKRLTFKNYAYEWLREHAEKELAPKTVFRYKQLLEDRIIPALGNIRLHKLTTQHLFSFYNNLKEIGIRKDGKDDLPLSELTIKHHHRLIYTILEWAVELQKIHANPAKSKIFQVVKSKKNQRQKPKAFSRQQVVAVLEAAKLEPLKYQIILLLALATGARQGELMGLEWKHIDFKHNEVTIEQSAQYLPGRGIFIKDTKNDSSNRTVPIDRPVMDALKYYKEQQDAERQKLGDQWQASDRLFTSWNGNPMYPNQMSSWFPRFLQRHKLPHLNFHGLRHTSATLLIAEGGTPVEVAQMLGHSTPSTTMTVYAHALKERERALARKMGKILLGKERNRGQK